MPTPTKPYPREALRSQLIITTRPGAAISRLQDVVVKAGGTLSPLFGPSRQQLLEEMHVVRARGADVPDLSVFSQVTAAEERYPAIVKSVRGLEVVTGAYVKPPADAPAATGLPTYTPGYSCAETACTPLSWAPPATPDLSASQQYLDPAPGGIDARYAWARAGGRGTDVEVVDVEREWRFTHEDLVARSGLAGGFPVNCLRERNHGSAVLGILGGDDNALGIKGICPDATVRGYSTRQLGLPEQNIPGTAETSLAIREAARFLTQNGTQLDTGHIILLELQRPGPDGYNIAVEWWWDDFEAIRYATALGLLVVEAAGNGHPTTGVGADLGHARYQVADPSFPGNWKNPFRRSENGVDCGAVIVGAGAPPLGTPRVDRSRLAWSNYGACVDAQGWGLEVFTAGYGCGQGGPSEDRWYTGGFGGTSAASAMVAGALACVQGFRRAAGKPTLDYREARNVLATHGSPQQADTGFPVGQKIGRRPDLRSVLTALQSGVAPDGKKPGKKPRKPPRRRRPRKPKPKRPRKPNVDPPRPRRRRRRR